MNDQHEEPQIITTHNGDHFVIGYRGREFDVIVNAHGTWEVIETTDRVFQPHGFVGFFDDAFDFITHIVDET